MGREGPEPVGPARESPAPLARRSAPPTLPERLGWLGVAFAALYLGSVYVKFPFVRPGVTLGDAIDVAAPFVLIFLYALVGRAVATSVAGGADTATRRTAGVSRLLLTLGGFALVLGHGMHVAANSIHDAIDRAGAPDPLGLVNWWDEHVSHYAIDSSKAAICAGLTALEARGTGAGGQGGTPGAPGVGGGATLAIGALAYGFIYFAGAVEGQTVPLLLPFCAAYLVWSFRRGRPFPPVRRFYTLAALVSILFFAVWGIWHRGFPEFSAVGLIP